MNQWAMNPATTSFTVSKLTNIDFRNIVFSYLYPREINNAACT